MPLMPLGLVRDGTLVEQVGDRVWVKREDLCSPYPGPSFAKIRGVVAHVRSRPEALIGVLDTFHSKAGWAVSYVCRSLGKSCLDFFPRYKGDGEVLRRQQGEAHGLGAELVALPAGRSAILYHTAKRETLKRGGYMMPNALKLPETVVEVAAEVGRTPALGRFDHLVISVSSGTIAAGVIAGFAARGYAPTLWLHLGYERSEDELLRYMREKAPALAAWGSPVSVISEGYGYKDAAPLGAAAPFPCNVFYDLKAYHWLAREGLARMSGRVLFWNVGA